MNRCFLATILCGVWLSAATSFAAGQPLSLSVAPRISGGNLIYKALHSRSLSEQQRHFRVILTNTSAKMVRFWQEDYSWGYYVLSFKLTDEHGKVWTARKKQAGFTVNIPAFWELAPKHRRVINVYFADTELWDGFPPRPARGTMRVVCEVHPGMESRELGVWTGRLVSDEVPFDFDY